MLHPEVRLRSKARRSPKEQLFLEAVAGPVTPAGPLTPAGRETLEEALGWGMVFHDSVVSEKLDFPGSKR